MAWKKIPGLNGRVYVPEPPPEVPRKHPCADCFSCQFCSDERCGVCRGCRGRCRNPEEEETDGSRDHKSKAQGP